ncbi:MAG: type II toxin-antitoxin system PemK/MazF family toxin [Bacteroidetes bacterium]|nr:type II toxin-antitoxin system PemK/MazF family toxin [Bacteroidota bacterium]MBU1677531.1 type II toxin-antitoxin system PemK/MazF family toxin [Bacteroidota bacterium]
MGLPSKGTIVLIRFPFSDLSRSKLRPALVVASTDKNDFILCQITSKDYGDSKSVKLVEADFETGSLQKVSFVRYTKIFTANNSIISSELGNLKEKKFHKIIDLLIEFLKD